MNTDNICKELQKLKSILIAEYSDELKRYKLHISKHLTKLANQYSVGWSGVSLRYRVLDSIKAILNKYYDEDSYEITFGEDYLGYWYIEIKD